MVLRTILLGLALVGCATAPSPPTTGAPDWLSGYWLSCEGNTETAENWIGAGRGVLLGTNITRGRRINYEFLRIAPNGDGVLTYYSMPNGRAPATQFTLASQEPGRVVFENLAHDFPQRIIYAREGDRLTARIEGQIDGRAESMSWSFRRARADATCVR